MTSREYLFIPAAQLDELDDENYAALLSALAAIGAVACSAHRDLHYPRLASFVYFRLDHGGVAWVFTGRAPIDGARSSVCRSR